MTIQALWLLRKLKKAQMHLDGCVGIDTDEMKAITVHISGQTFKSVSIKFYKNSLDATLDYLAAGGFIRFQDRGLLQVTYPGWHILSMTVVEVTKIILLNVLLPVIVSVIAAIITTRAMS